MFFPGFKLEHIAVGGGSIRLRRGGSGPPLLLLHGNPQTHAMWHAVAPELAKRFTVICPDLRGYGWCFRKGEYLNVGLGRLVLRDAETGEVIEINTGDARKRAAFTERQAKAQTDTARLFRSAGIDSIQLRTDQPYGVALAKFFETREKRRRHG